MLLHLEGKLMKKFNLNGVNVELSKEKLQDMLKEYDKPKWEIKAGSNRDIELWKNGSRKKHLLWSENEANTFNLSTISRHVAVAMDDLIETKDVLSENVIGFTVSYSLNMGQWVSNCYRYAPNKKHFKSQKVAQLAAKILNESQDMKNWIERMSK